MPAVILAVAGGLAVWGARQETDRQLEIERLAAALLDDVAAGRDPAARLGATDALIARSLIPALEEIVAADPARAGEIEILVVPGDLETEADLLQPATHTATLRRDDEALLGLRLVHHGRRDRIAIIGFWRPPARAGP